jgi:hypothetical protein
VLVTGVPIDVEIAPLTEALWERGIETLNSCQDNGDNHQVWIEFATPDDASRFLNAGYRTPGRLPNAIWPRNGNDDGHPRRVDLCRLSAELRDWGIDHRR